MRREIPNSSRDSFGRRKMEGEESTSSVESQTVQSSRGRGRGRPPRRGRGRGRGRGTRPRSQGRSRSPRDSQRRDQAMLHQTEERISVIKRHVEQLTHVECQNFIVEVAKRSTGLIFDLIDLTRQPQGGYHPPSSTSAPSWCTCHKCRDMPTQVERVCCGRQPEHCTTLLPDFHVLILDEAVLALARLYREDVLAVPADEDYNRGNRHAAYRQYILWTHGRLGAGIRKTIPSCCVWKIRDKYPDPYGQYVGFIPGRIE